MTRPDMTRPDASGNGASAASRTGGDAHATAAAPPRPLETGGTVAVTVERVRAELDQIVDPCSAVAGAPAGLVEMGLLRELAIHAGPGGVAVQLRIGVTEPGCLMGGSFAVQARERLERLHGVTSVEVELDHAADWSPADLAPDYRRRLEAARAERRQALQDRRAAQDGGRGTPPRPAPPLTKS